MRGAGKWGTGWGVGMGERGQWQLHPRLVLWKAAAVAWPDAARLPGPPTGPRRATGCTTEDAWPSCPGLLPAQLSQEDCFLRDRLSLAWWRGRPQAGEATCPVQPAPLAWPSSPSPFRFPGTATTPIRLPGQGYVPCRPWCVWH